jgi:hypothetical protein
VPNPRVTRLWLGDANYPSDEFGALLGRAPKLLGCTASECDGSLYRIVCIHQLSLGLDVRHWDLVDDDDPICLAGQSRVQQLASQKEARVRHYYERRAELGPLRLAP